MTQGFLCISPRVALDKTPSTSKKKFYIGRLTLSILNSSSLMLTELQKSLTPIDSFKKVMARKDGEEGWRGRMTRKDDDFSPYALVSLRTRLPTHSSYRYVRVPAGRTFRRYLSEIVHLSRRHPQSSQYAARKLSCRLDATDLLPCVVVSLVISIGRSNWLDDKRSPSEMSSN